MNMNFQGSEEIVLEELKLFQIPPTEAAVVKSEWKEYCPLSGIGESGAIDFRICSEENEYIDLKRSLLKVTCKVIKEDGSDIPAGESVVLRNNMLHTLWKQIDIYLNEVLISKSSDNYAYKAYLDTILNENALNNNEVGAWGYYKEETAHMNDTDASTSENTSLVKRYALAENSMMISLLGPLKVDVCSSDKWILPKVDISIRLWQTKSAFRLSKPFALNYPVKVHIYDIVFLANKITVQPEINKAHEQILNSVHAKYPYNRSRVQTYLFPKHAICFEESEIFQKETPSTVIVALLSQKSYCGDHVENPYNFKNYSVKNIDFTLDDISLNGFHLNHNDVETFYQLYSFQGKDNGSFNGPNISLEDYKNVSFYMFDTLGGLKKPLTPKIDSLHSPGESKLIIKMNEALDENAIVLIYGVFYDMFQIDKSRNILL